MLDTLYLISVTCADNTGGLVTDAVLLHVMNVKARVVICGQISQYNTGLDQPATGPRFLHRVLFTRATIQGILYFDWEDRLDEMIQQMLVWIQQGKLQLLSFFLSS